MSERFIRCAHCGLPHDAHVAVCPTTGLRIEQGRPAKRRRAKHRDREAHQQRMIGRVIDQKYRINAVIGEGGMSSIYEAEHFGLDRRVALKILHPSLAEDPEAIARLNHEAKVVATIGHPNICEVFDLGRTGDGSPYLVMELLVGESLADRLKLGGAMHFIELVPLLKQVLAALDAAHNKGILHRDLKPENVFIEAPRQHSRPTAKLLDFGISKSMAYEFQEHQRLTSTGMVMGTPYYMAPEQARGDSGLDQRVDLWAVGVIMYEALAGRRPFVATNYNALLVKILTSRPRPAQKIQPSIPPRVAAIIDKALSKLREDRYQTSRAFLDALNNAERLCLAEDPTAQTRFFSRPVARNVRRHPSQQPAPHPSPHPSQHPSQHPPAPPPAPHPSAGRPSPSRTAGDSYSGHWDIEDPATFIDDDFAYDPSQIPGPMREYQPPAPPVYEAPPHDDWEAEPVEPTIRERMTVPHYEDSAEGVPHAPPHQPHEPHDTEVIRRGDVEQRERLASVPDSLRDTDVIERTRLFAEQEKTEVVLMPPSEPEEHTPVLIPPEHTAPVRDSSEAARPRVPRPKPPPDDEEKTTLFDPEKARALRDKTDPE